MEGFIKWLLDASITASFLAVAVAVLRLFIKKAPKFITVLLWGLVALRLIMPALPESKLSIIPDAAPITNTAESIIPTEKPSVSVPPPVKPPVADNPSITPPNDTAEDTEGAKAPASPWNAVFWVWTAGVGGMLIYAFISWRKVLATVKEAVPADDGAWMCDSVSSPFICGLFRPRIYLPVSLSAEDRIYVTSHEKAHLKRGDHLWKPLGFLLLSLHWFNPVMWLAYILLCRDIELACDEKAILALGEEHKKPYSHALINCAAKARLISACPVAFGENSIKSRVKTVLSYKKPTLWIIIIAVLAGIVTSVLFLTNPEKEKEPVIFGQWYGDCVYNAGESFLFNEDGTGAFFAAKNYARADINWLIEDGKLSIALQNDRLYGIFPGDYIVSDYSLDEEKLIITSAEGKSYAFVKNKNTYGGDDALVLVTGWHGQDGEDKLNINEHGVIEGTLNGKRIYGLHYAKDGVITFINEQGEKTDYTYSLGEKKLTLKQGNDTFVLYSETLTDDTKPLPETPKWQNLNGWTLKGDTLTLEKDCDMSNIPDFAVANKDVKKVVISGNLSHINEYCFKDFTSLTEVVFLPNDSEYNIDSIFNLNENAFYGCTSLEVLELPATLRTFVGCSYATPNLKEYKVPEESEYLTVKGGALYSKSEGILYKYPAAKGGVFTADEKLISIDNYAFAGCKGLTEINLNDKITGFGVGVFYGCSSIKELVLPDEIKTVYDNTFSYCTSLESITLPEKLQYFYIEQVGMPSLKEYKIGENSSRYDTIDGVLYTVNKAGDVSTLVKCPQAKTGSFIMPETVQIVEEYAFRDCVGITAVTVSPVTKWLNDRAFMNCTALKSVTLPNTITALKAEIFYGCKALNSINYQGTAEEWGDIASENPTNKELFWFSEEENKAYTVNCLDKTLKETVPERHWTLDENGTFTLFGDYERTAWEIYLPQIKNVIIKGNVKSVCYGAFSQCDNLESVTVEDGVETIGSYVFSYCYRLKTVRFPDSVKEIGSSLFFECRQLMEANLPEGIKRIEADTFFGCDELGYIHIPDSVEFVGFDAFYGCKALSVSGGKGIKTIDIGAFAGSGISGIGFAVNAESIGANAFYGCEFNDIVIPKGVTVISERLFNEAKINTVTIHSGVTEIQQIAFHSYKYGHPKTIIYESTVAEWRKIKLGVQWIGSDPELTITVKCTDGTITENNVDGIIYEEPGCGGVY